VVKQRTALANQIRGLLGEYGIVVGYGISQVRRRIPEILEDGENGLTDRFRVWLGELLESFRVLDERIKQYDEEVQQAYAANEACRRLGVIEGIGPQIATAVMEASSELVDELSNIARADTTRHAQYELERAQERLTNARISLRELRDNKQIVDPRIDLESRMGVLTALQTQLATAVIEYDLVRSTTTESDPRVSSISRRIAAIEERIASERDKLGQKSSEGVEALASVIGEFETLLADREFAEEAYTAAAASYDTALAEARRKSRYLAAPIPPTRAESSQYPSRLLIGVGLFGSLLLFWLICVLTVYAVMDRR
jgi:capsule polysaccharide export protein KpsE/RkpR